jgi:hypothetical protein
LEQTPETLDVGAVRNLLNGLILLQSHLRLYGASNANANVAHTTTRLQGFLARLFAEHPAVTIHVARHAFVLAEGFIDRDNRNFEKYANSLFSHGIAALTLQQGLTDRELHSFLQLVSRRPAETWDEGGIGEALRQRQIERVSVREMAEQDFQLMDSLAGTGAEQLQHQRSHLWVNFSLAILHGLHRSEPDWERREEWTPAALAGQINRILETVPEAEQQTFAHDASRFLIALKHEKIRIYRSEALANLAAFVSSLTPRLRQLFLDHAYTLNLDADLSEGFLRGLSDAALLEAFRSAAESRGYTPPVVLKLLGRLAQERQLVESETLAVTDANRTEAVANIHDLFRQDEFEKYVPAGYREALSAILQRQSLPAATATALDRLKMSLEPQYLERHLGEIVMDILHEVPDARHLGGFLNNLLNTVRFCASQHDYARIGELLEISHSGQAGPEVTQELDSFLSSPEFVNTAFDTLPQLEPGQSDALWQLFVQMPAPFVAPLLERLGAENSRGGRLAYLKGLVRLGSACNAPAVQALGDPRWFVVRNMLYLLRELGDPAALPQIRQCLRHPHFKVQQEALRTCLALRDERATPFLLQALEEKSGAELVSVITLAGLTQHPQVIKRLFALLHCGTLLDYQLDVKKAAVQALAVAAQQQCLPVFAELLASRNLLQSRAHEQLKLEIVAALAKFPPLAARSLLQPLASSGSAELAHAALLTLSRLDRNPS